MSDINSGRALTREERKFQEAYHAAEGLRDERKKLCAEAAEAAVMRIVNALDKSPYAHRHAPTVCIIDGIEELLYDLFRIDDPVDAARAAMEYDGPALDDE